MSNKVSETRLARTLLETLLRSADAAVSRASARPSSRNFKGLGNPYWGLDADARQAFHAELRDAERRGAVGLKWARFGGDERPLERVWVEDIERLALILGTSSLETMVQQAADRFSPWLPTIPRLGDVLDAWREGRPVRKGGPETAGAFVDAARVIGFMQSEAAEQPVRVASRRLFRNSKRIEALIPQLDVLGSDTWPAPVNHREHVLARIGLRVSPLPFLMAGGGSVQLRTSGSRALAFEYLAVTPTEVIGFEGTPRWVMCIENLTTFGMAARQMGNAAPGLVLYTGGMPSPSWRRAFQAVLSALPDIPVYHWGDIDEGGFRIASVIALSMAPRALLPWQMDPGEMTDCDKGTPAKRERMATAARRAGWDELATRLETHPPVLLEQEHLDVLLPAG